MGHQKTLDLSRRQMLGCITNGLVAAVAAPALSRAAGEMNETRRPANAGEKKKSAPDYPKPPFPSQHQEWPGLASQMTPRPDHGETTYEGHARLEGRKA